MRGTYLHLLETILPVPNKLTLWQKRHVPRGPRFLGPSEKRGTPECTGSPANGRPEKVRVPGEASDSAKLQKTWTSECSQKR